MGFMRWAAALSFVATACASRDVPLHYPASSAASPKGKPAPAADVTRAFTSDGPWSNGEAEAPAPDHAGHGGHHGH